MDLTPHWTTIIGTVKERLVIFYGTLGRSPAMQHLPQKIAAEAIGPLPPEAPSGRERDELTRVLREARGNQSAAARMLVVSRVTVWKRMKKHRIDHTRDVN